MSAQFLLDFKFDESDVREATPDFDLFKSEETVTECLDAVKGIGERIDELNSEMLAHMANYFATKGGR